MYDPSIPFLDNYCRVTKAPHSRTVYRGLFVVVSEWRQPRKVYRGLFVMVSEWRRPRKVYRGLSVTVSEWRRPQGPLAALLRPYNETRFGN